MSALEETVTVSARLTATTEAVPEEVTPPEEAAPTEAVEAAMVKPVSHLFIIAGAMIAYYLLGKIARTR